MPRAELPAYRSEGRQYRWADGKRRTVEAGLAALLHEAETRAVEDRQRQIDEENAKARRKVQWERAMQDAQKKAVVAHYATILTRQAERWRHADELRAYCQALEQRLDTLDPAEAGVSDAREWLDWVRDHVAKIDPLSTLPKMPESPKISAEDLRLRPRTPASGRGLFWVILFLRFHFGIGECCCLVGACV